MKKVTVLMGGTSNERAVSLASGTNVAQALASLGAYDVTPLVLDEDNLDALPAGTDAVYIALHGGWGENGGVQQELDKRGIPYTGPGVEASRLAMDKILTKKRLDARGVSTSAWYTVRKDSLPPCRLPFPVVVKAPRDGSSVGVYKCADEAEYGRAVREAWRIDQAKYPDLSCEALVETYVPGREMTVGIIDGTPLPVVEIVAPGGWYGYDDKYKSDLTRYPFLTDAQLAASLQQEALRAWEALGCRGVARVDFRVDAQGRGYVLELNTSPGFTSHSLVPKAGMALGLTFAQVCDRILRAANFDRT
ncbi:MAG TPA: D-alanine--D-alanine ligase [Verrucomicrobia bacterium]|nr:D-alanine--D-alanine ligase [Verrucomicrobiota bacterium]HCG20150.1 D-alanine--D-alanine ligase [Verrucomicrobiota bacterium]